MNVGDYVRYKKTVYHNQGVDNIRISKIKHISDTDYNMKFIFFENGNGEYEENIIKSSPNIIDLIEVGDYVNSKRVEWIGYDLYKENKDKTLTGIGEKRILFNEFTKDSVRKNGIKTIVTREQFSQMEYKVGE